MPFHTSLQSAVIVAAIRSPMGRGKPGGALSGVHPAELLGQVIVQLLERAATEPAMIEDVLVGCVGQSGEQSGNVGRMAWLGAGLPVEVPSVTIERKCGSGQQAIDFAVQGIQAGAYDVVIAAGVESMSHVPIGSPRMDKDPYSAAVAERFSPGLVPQGISADLVAERWSIPREELDAFSARSHHRAAAAAAAGEFAAEIVGIDTPEGRVTADETIRPDSSPEALAKLRLAFDAPQWRERFPQMEFTTTAGNSSQLTDGASALLICSERYAIKHDLTPIARVHASAGCGDDPVMMLTGPIPATRRVLGRAEMEICAIDHVEVNEAFASVPLAWQREFGIAEDRLNPHGGAIALGHPLGASGCRLMTTMIHSLGRRGGRWGLQTMCEAGGMANATIIERL